MELNQFVGSIQNVVMYITDNNPKFTIWCSLFITRREMEVGDAPITSSVRVNMANVLLAEQLRTPNPFCRMLPPALCSLILLTSLQENDFVSVVT